MTDTTATTAYASAFLAIARAEGDTTEVEDELFRFARAFEASDELRETLSNPRLPAAVRTQIVQDLLGDTASSTTVALISTVVSTGRTGDLPKIVESFVEQSAGSRGEAVAEVRSAVALTEDQRSRLAEALTAQMSRPVTVRNIVDPTVLGGIVTQIGDTLLDGSVRTRLGQLRDAF